MAKSSTNRISLAPKKPKKPCTQEPSWRQTMPPYPALLFTTLPSVFKATSPKIGFSHWTKVVGTV
ncbi:Translocating chain-associated membrane protein 2 [Sesbania bispinosa]|nr:Translocating chain-associated membrane protein 2 [Sesbania bispinosa]